MEKVKMQGILFISIKHSLEKIRDCEEKTSETRIEAVNLIHSLARFKSIYLIFLSLVTFLFGFIYFKFITFLQNGGIVSISIIDSDVLNFTILNINTNIGPFVFVLILFLIIVVYFYCVHFLKNGLINSFFSKIKPSQLHNTDFSAIKEKVSRDIFSNLSVLIDSINYILR